MHDVGGRGVVTIIDKIAGPSTRIVMQAPRVHHWRTDSDVQFDPGQNQQQRLSLKENLWPGSLVFGKLGAKSNRFLGCPWDLKIYKDGEIRCDSSQTLSWVDGDQTGRIGQKLESSSSTLGMSNRYPIRSNKIALSCSCSDVPQHVFA